MPRLFNTAGPCLASEHYLLDPCARLPQILDLIDGKFSFVLHAPRQTGKTTLLRSLSASLTGGGRYAAITVSLESFTSDDVAAMMPQILEEVREAARNQLPPELPISHPPGSDFHPG